MKHLYELLNELGVSNHGDNDDPIQSMEVYLGLQRETKGSTGSPLLEDRDETTPERLLELWTDLLICVWNVPVDRIDDYDLTTIEAVRATQWLRQWLEYEPKFLPQLVGRLQDTATSHQSSSLIRSLYKHVADLANVQFLVYRLRKQASQRDPHTMVQTDVSQRLLELKTQNERFVALEGQYNKYCSVLERLLGDVYSCSSARQRKLQRRLLSGIWTQYIHVSKTARQGGLVQENTQAAAIPLTLALLKRLTISDSTVSEHLRRTILLPLHAANGIVLWRDQTPVLELYHRVLSECLTRTLSSTEAIFETIAELGKVLHKSSSSKQVLLLHEMDGLLELLDADAETSSSFFRDLVSIVASYASSDHSRVAERALLFFKNQTFERLLHTHFPVALSSLLPILVRKESWNPTVRKMTYHVLKQLQDHDAAAFEEACNRLFASQTLPEKRSMQHQKPAAELQPPPPRRRPPTMAPPPPVQRYAKGATPPLTITGVAPWAMSSQPSAPRRVQRPTPAIQETGNGATAPSKPQTGFDYVQRFMKSIQPPVEDTGVSTWSKMQMAETPTYLPNLKFHDLVFGQDLGSGAFGFVRYARLIDKTKTRSHWPEYAVKVISTEKIHAMGYETSVQREIAVLRVLSHPGIARLVSSFRFHDGAYLVLEYASRGDLHTLLHTKGSLDVDSTRFVVGEVVAALSSIHQDGFVFADLKPENIVITEPGHIKLTDFGACRPVSDSAKETIATISKNLLKNLRDGDWKSHTKKTKNESQPDDWSKQENDEQDLVEEDPAEDQRIEGTTAYLPPEVVMGQFPDYSADSWALGCVMYQCLSGRPPLLEADEETTRSRIVTFHVGGESDDMSELDRLFADKHAEGISAAGREVITSLLDRDPSRRPGMTQVASFDFFSSNVFELHQKPATPLGAGIVAPKPNARWARRQMSSIWAPQPEAYDLLALTKNQSATASGESSNGPIEEGGESSGFFSASGNETKQMAVTVPNRFLTPLDQT